MTPTRVIVEIEYRAQLEQIDRALVELDRLVATVVARESDCFGIRLLQGEEDPTRLLLIEEWTSQEAYLGPHFETPHLQEFIARAPELFLGPPVIQFWLAKSEHSLRDSDATAGGS